MSRSRRSGGSDRTASKRNQLRNLGGPPAIVAGGEVFVCGTLPPEAQEAAADLIEALFRGLESGQGNC